MWFIHGTALRWNAPFIDRPDTYEPCSVVIRRWCSFDEGAFVDEAVKTDVGVFSLRRGEVPLVVNHDESAAVGWVSELKATQVGLEYWALLDPVLLPEDMRALMPEGMNPSSSVSLNRLSYAPGKHSGPPEVCTCAILTDISLIWTPAMADTRVGVVSFNYTPSRAVDD